MAGYSQAGRMLAVTTPLGPDVLLLQQLSGTEAVSQLFHFELELLADSSQTIAFDKILGQNVTAAITLPDGSKRYINGFVNRFSQGHRVPSGLGTGTLTRYRAEVVPKLWFLTRHAQSRIFQQISVPDILKKVLASITPAFQLQGTYQPRDYCVQYRESDFAFASRLMEEEGIYYYFTHANGSHQMVVADTPQSHADVPGPTKVIFETLEGGTRQEDRVHAWEKTQELRSGKYRLWDSCFELPGKNLEATQPVLDAVQAGTVSHKLKVGGNDQMELYDYPGGYAQRFDGIAPGGGDRAGDVQKIFDDNKRTVAIRMQQETTPTLAVAGASTCRQFVAGCKFNLDRHFDANGPYVLIHVNHFATVGDAYTSGHEDSDPYTNDFTCIPLALPFRPERAMPRPRVEGAQTATVVGNPGDEIFTDKYSRVKVQFHWDREGKNNANSSCWVRVATLWAGAQWGAIHIPRVGQEVVVAFEDGDPDRPLIVGSVYNAAQMPPYDLPGNKTQSGIKSRSSLGGAGANYNEIRFEDKKGSELVTIHAEKDQSIEVEHDEAHWVGHDRTKNIDHDETTHVKHDRTETVDNNEKITIGVDRTENVGNNETISIGSNRTETVGKNESITVALTRTRMVGVNESVSVGAAQQINVGGARTVTVGAAQAITVGAAQTITVGGNETENYGSNHAQTVGGDQTVNVTGAGTYKISKARTTEVSENDELKVDKTWAVVAAERIVFKTGDAEIEMKKDGTISIKGKDITVQGSGAINVKADKDIVMKGQNIEQN
jgi:type VI secretion system secreted protein VgrG